MPEESDATVYRRIFVDFLREIHTLRANHDALLCVFLEELSESDRIRALAKYDTLRKVYLEKILLEIGDSAPDLSEDLAKQRPWPSLGDQGGKP